MTRHYFDILAETIRKNWNKVALEDYRTIIRYTYGDMACQMERVGRLLDALEVRQGVHVALCGNNCSHWAIAYLGVATWGGVCVGIMQDFSAEDIAKLINHSDSEVLIASEAIRTKLKGMELPKVKYVIAMETLQVMDSEIQATLPHLTPQDISYNTNNMDELAMICYTSGSSGMPKGVMLSYRSLSSNLQAGRHCMPNKPGWHHLSTLPVAHMYGLTCELLYHVTSGCPITYLAGRLSMTVLGSALREIKPYNFITIPLVVEKLYQNQILPKLSDNIRSWMRKPVLGWLVRRRVWHSVNKALGGNIRYLLVGGAALRQDVAEFLQWIGCPLSNGYGMTECGPLIGAQTMARYKAGSGGVIVDNMQIRLDPENQEIQVRGENVMIGYYKNEQANARTFTPDGWLRTGDIGEIDKRGNIFIRGHVSSMIKLNNGEKVFPEAIENILNAQNGVIESLVICEDEKLIAKIVTDAQMDLERLKQAINEKLPVHSRLTRIEENDTEFTKTVKQSIKRYLYQKKSDDQSPKEAK